MLLCSVQYGGIQGDHIHSGGGIYIAIKLDKTYFGHAFNIIIVSTEVEKRKLY